MNAIYKFVMAMLAKRGGKTGLTTISRATDLNVELSVKQIQKTLEKMGVDVSKIKSAKEVEKFLNINEAWIKQQAKKSPIKKKDPFEGWKPTVVKDDIGIKQRMDKIKGMSDELAKMQEEKLALYGKKKPTEAEIKAKLEGMNKKTIERIKRRRFEAAQKAEREKMAKDPEYIPEILDPDDFASGGIAGMLGERTNLRRGGPPGGGDPEMKGTGQSYGDSYGPGRDYKTPSDRPPGIDISASPQRQQFLQEGIRSLQSEMADRRGRGETRQDVTDYLRIHGLNQPERWGHRFGPDPSFFKKFHRPYKKISDLPPGVLEMLMKEPGMTEDKILGMWWALPEFTRQELWEKHGKPKDWELETWRSKVNVRPGYTEKKNPWELEELRQKRMERDPPWGMSGSLGNFMFTKPFGEDDMSDMAKAGIFGHEVRHDIYNTDPWLWETQPEWVQKVEKSGTPEHKQFGDQYLAGHELYNRFLDERYFPPDPSRPKTIDEPYFDKILSDLWAPTAKDYELPAGIYQQEVLDQWKKDFPEMGGGITDIIPEGPV